MAIFNSKLLNYQRVTRKTNHQPRNLTLTCTHDGTRYHKSTRKFSNLAGINRYGAYQQPMESVINLALKNLKKTIFSCIIWLQSP